jgi:hypothetical protein
MELLYLWIEKYKNIKEQGFNFSGEYRFEYKHESGELSVTINPNYIRDFFPEGISNVSAIIGENGSGKSTVLKFIKETQIAYPYDDSTPSGRLGKFMMIFSDKRILHHKDLKVIPDSSLTGWKLIPFTKKEDIYTDSFPIVFYSNTFQSERMPLDAFNLSNYHLLEYSNHIKDIAYQAKIITQTQAFREENLKLQVKFVNEILLLKPDFVFPFPIPSQLYFNFSQDNFTYIGLSPFKENNTDKITILKESVKIKEMNQPQDFLENLYLSFAVAAIINSVSFLPNEDREEEIKEINQIFTTTPNETNVPAYIHHIESRQNQGKRIEINTQRVRESLKYFSISNLEQFITDKKLYLEQNSMLLPIQNNTELINHFISLGFSTSIFDYRWSNGISIINLSNGEEAFLIILSRFYNLLYKKYSKNENGDIKNNDFKDSDKLMILIDEGDLGFHPEWQKRFIKILIDYFVFIFGDIEIGSIKSIKKNIQLILTSHSPFIASDLPKEHIIFLRKGESKDEELENNCIVVKEGDKKHPNLPQTFGQNIHTLFADSFFMKGTMGDYAEYKINELVLEIKNLNTNSDKELIKKKIELIGEPILRTKIESYFKKVIAEKTPSIDEQIAQAEKELERLKEKKQNDSNKKEE